MSYSIFGGDESSVVCQKSMLDTKYFGIGEESESSSGSFVCLFLSDEETFQNLMKGTKVTSNVNVFVSDINAIPIESNEDEEKYVFDRIWDEPDIGGDNIVVGGGGLEKIVWSSAIKSKKKG